MQGGGRDFPPMIRGNLFGHNSISWSGACDQAGENMNVVCHPGVEKMATFGNKAWEKFKCDLAYSYCYWGDGALLYQ